MTSDDERIPVVLLSGFLGSGKTTLLNAALARPELSRTLVVVNEFGAASLDHRLYTAANESEVVALPGGCLCCGVRGDLVRTLGEAPGRFARAGERQFDRVVIETSGLADPAPILQTLLANRRLARRYRLAGVISCIDGVHADSTLDRHTEAVQQVVLADALVVTKTDLIAPTAVASLYTGLTRLNPLARVHDGRRLDRDLVSLFTGTDASGSRSPARSRDRPKIAAGVGLQPADSPSAALPTFDEGLADATGIDDARHDAAIVAVHWNPERALDRQRLASGYADFVDGLGGHLLRLKGVVEVIDDGRPWAIDGVRHVWHPPVALPADAGPPTLVAIGRRLDRAWVRAVFAEAFE